jgi:hypothetical protein
VVERRRSAPGAADRVGGVVARVRAAWNALAPEQRLAAVAALLLFLTMFLPWYGKDVIVLEKGKPTGFPQHDALNAFQVFSFVEAAVLLVAGGVLGLLFARAERRTFHLPGGDGTVISAAGAWAALLILIRMFDKPDASGNSVTGVTVGIEWGIFIALAAAVALALAGQRLRRARVREPEGPEDWLAETDRPARRRRAARSAGANGASRRREPRRRTAGAPLGDVPRPEDPPAPDRLGRTEPVVPETEEPEPEPKPFTPPAPPRRGGRRDEPPGSERLF